MKLKVTNCNTDSLAEEGQQAQIKFAVCMPEGNTLVNITPWIKCRDFFNEMIYIQQAKYQEELHIYGFHWEYNNELQKLMNNDGIVHVALGVAEKEKEAWEKNMYLLTLADKAIGAEPTGIEIIEHVYDGYNLNYKTFYHLKMDSKWFSNSVMFSMFTFFIRLFCNPNLEAKEDLLLTLYSAASSTEFVKANYGDGNLLRQTVKNTAKFEYFLKHWEELTGFQPQPIDDSCTGSLVGKLHNGSGIASMMHGIDCVELSNVADAVKPWVEKFWQRPDFPKDFPDSVYEGNH